MDQLTLVAWMNILTSSSTRDGDCRTAFLSRSSSPGGHTGQLSSRRFYLWAVAIKEGELT